MSLILRIPSKIKSLLLYIMRNLFNLDNDSDRFAAAEICNAILDEDNVKCITLIHENPDCINTPIGPDGYTPFLIACLSGNTQIVKYMLHFGADIHQKSYYNESPFYLATFCNVKDPKDKNASCLNTLYIAGADINAATDKGFTPLQLASVFGKTNLVRWLLHKGADLSVHPHPYILARSQGFQHTAESLLEWQRNSMIAPAIKDIQ